jgi:hypothetical protein
VTRNTERVQCSRVKYVINHGATTAPPWATRYLDEVPWYNTPEIIMTSSNKLMMFNALHDCPVLPVDTTPARRVAEEWIEQGSRVMARTMIRSSQGNGIVISPDDPLPNASLYTKVFTGPRVREYRAYIVAGKCVDLVEKRRYTKERRERIGIESNIYTKLVRAHKNGWAFCRNTFDVNEEDKSTLMDAGTTVAKHFNLGWGAVDLIASLSDDKELLEVRAIETNSSIGLTNDQTTVDKLADAWAEVIA